ncbi:CPBP family intramembrane metalloprotease [Chloroflexi bacterium TSY]|nr:CPBP family intramembrane metalloprotease [Chloroflexi bacterium TSY]
MTTITSRITNPAIFEMETNNDAPTNEHLSKVSLFFMLFGLGILGVLTLWWQPLTIPDELYITGPPGIWGLIAIVLRVLVLVQSALLLVILLLIGVNTAPRVGLHAPVIEALVSGSSVWYALKPQLIPGLFGGLLTVGILGLYGWIQFHMMPTQIDVGAEMPLLMRVLYGGITEELIARWGLMSLFVWAGWRFVQRRQGAPRFGTMWGGNILAALCFGLLHLPTAFMLGMTGPLWSVLIIGINTLVGLVYGWLFWRRGLEASMIAHTTMHLIAFAVLRLQ